MKAFDGRENCVQNASRLENFYSAAARAQPYRVGVQRRPAAPFRLSKYLLVQSRATTVENSRLPRPSTSQPALP